MFIANMTHFLDEEGNIAQQMHKQGRSMASFLALIIDAMTQDSSETIGSTDIRCYKKGCDGIIMAELEDLKGDIEWFCPHCHEGGRISAWQGTRWNNQKILKNQ